jgi:colicin import membrane protein
MSTSIQEYSRTDAALSELCRRYQGATYQVQTSDGMKAAKEARAKLRGYRIDLEQIRKEIKAPALQRCQQIDSEAKRITMHLRMLEDPIDKVIASEEGRREADKRAREEAEARAEAEKKAKIDAAIAAISAPVFGVVGKSSEEILAQIKETQAIDTSAPEYGPPQEVVAMNRGIEAHDFIDRALVAKNETLGKLRVLCDDAVKRESERARLEELETQHAAAEEARAEVERTRFVAAVAPMVDNMTALRLEARIALADIVLRFSDIPELSPVISAIRTYLKEHI